MSKQKSVWKQMCGENKYIKPSISLTFKNLRTGSTRLYFTENSNRLLTVKLLTQLHILHSMNRPSKRREHWLVLQPWHQVLFCFRTSWHWSLRLHSPSQPDHSNCIWDVAGYEASDGLYKWTPILRRWRTNTLSPWRLLQGTSKMNKDDGT